MGIKKKITVLLIIVLLTIPVNMPQIVYATSGKTKDENQVTKQTVIKIFESQSNSKDMGTRITANQNLKTFNSLSDEKKKEFVEIINNPDKLNKKMTVEVENSSLVNTVTAAKTTRKNVGKNFNYKLLGVNMYGLHLDVSYQVSGGKVSKTTGSSAYCTYSYNPLVKINFITKTNYVSQDKQAYARAKFRYAVGPFKGMSAQICVRAVSVAGNGKGELSYWNDWREG
ncbi:hypothetical protein [Listeria ivanovii]|uniref:hypothetical protein n=1 Tax=Listeria ivanovii TaxID=1638 RepID=UPI00190DC6AD|nr:hypothetical protein [Listeria ivanovii]MBK3913752.1 hypothetical protein [Listeria ivanovii subsp. ivanovii]MBK3920130.1 hypothetical protein [Listeria ivanovii subsp. ivanovii]MBK3926041.1 hypothetical protein [Listeria ivanovii subsp. ivanovii]